MKTARPGVDTGSHALQQVSRSQQGHPRGNDDPHPSRAKLLPGASRSLAAGAGTFGRANQEVARPPVSQRKSKGLGSPQALFLWTVIRLLERFANGRKHFLFCDVVRPRDGQCLGHAADGDSHPGKDDLGQHLQGDGLLEAVRSAPSTGAPTNRALLCRPSFLESCTKPRTTKTISKPLIMLFLLSS